MQPTQLHRFSYSPTSPQQLVFRFASPIAGVQGGGRGADAVPRPRRHRGPRRRPYAGNGWGHHLLCSLQCMCLVSGSGLSVLLTCQRVTFSCGPAAYLAPQLCAHLL